MEANDCPVVSADLQERWIMSKLKAKWKGVGSERRSNKMGFEMGLFILEVWV